MIDAILLNGDCLEVMREFPNNSIDTIITDPPYGLKFMGNKWDYNIPSTDVWSECLRIAKPGTTLLAFGGTRTWHRLAASIEDSGWEIRDCLMWLYGSGFPKGCDISKGIDKSLGAEREVIGNNPNHRNCNSTFQSSTSGTLTAPTTEQAKQWDGWKTALKPAWEPIIIAQKPIDGTYANNALVWGVGGFNIEGARIGTDTITTHNIPGKTKFTNVYGAFTQTTGDTQHTGRYPANLILDEDTSALLDEQSGNVSRFFYCAKVSPTERANNNHPTLKPIKLMDYLCKLTATPTGGNILDPFMGSGSTGVSAIRNGRKFIGIELNPEYLEIAKTRINNELENIRTEATTKTTNDLSSAHITEDTPCQEKPQYQ